MSLLLVEEMLEAQPSVAGSAVTFDATS